MKHRWTDEDLQQVKEKRVRGGQGIPKKLKITVDGPYVFTLTMQIPSGKNAVRITRTGHRYPNKRFSIWRADAIKSLPSPLPIFCGPVELIVNYTPGDKKRRDVPGMLDAICHLIEKIGIVVDDAQVKNVMWTTFETSKKKPLCMVSVNPLRQGGAYA